MERNEIDINVLKSKYKVDSLPYHLWYVALDCKKRRDAFWRHHFLLKRKNNLVSVPLLLMSSITGVTSVANLGGSDKGFLPIIVSVFGVSSAVLTAFQKYFRYAERAEHAKHMAKTYGRIARRIENTMILVESSAVTMKPEAFLKFVEEVQKDTDSLLAETDDIPKELIHSKRWYSKMFDAIKPKKIENGDGPMRVITSEESTSTSDDMEECPVCPNNNEVWRKVSRVSVIEKEIKTLDNFVALAKEEARIDDALDANAKKAELRIELRALQSEIDALAKEHSDMVKSGGGED